MVILFGAGACLGDANALRSLRVDYPQATLVGCTTAGEISGSEVLDNSIIATAVSFERTGITPACVNIGDFPCSRTAGRALAEAVAQAGPAPDAAGGLNHVFVLADGLHVNGSDLARGMSESLPANVAITGGLAADADRFERTLVLFSKPGEPNPVAKSGSIAAVGFHGSSLHTACGSLGGWDPFGPERRITRSRGNVLYELDGQSALQLYKRYLGTHAAALPASGLLFPLAIRTPDDTVLVRTILAISEADQSLTFAGDVPEGHLARLMKANFDRLVDGATGAARATLAGSPTPDLAILISCVGRRLVLKQRVEDEIEGVREVLGHRPSLAGFYSYGEISPVVSGSRCELHNQTMTITTFREI